MTEAPELTDNAKIGIIEDLKKIDPSRLSQALNTTETEVQKFLEILNSPFYPRQKIENNRRSYTNSPLNLSDSLLYFLARELNINIHHFPVVRAEIYHGKVFWQLVDPVSDEVVYDRQLARKNPEFKFGENSWKMSWEDFQEFKDGGEEKKKEPERVFTLHLINFDRNHAPNRALMTTGNTKLPRDWKTFERKVTTQLSKKIHVSALGKLRTIYKNHFFQPNKDETPKMDKVLNDKARELSTVKQFAAR